MNIYAIIFVVSSVLMLVLASVTDRYGKNFERATTKESAAYAMRNGHIAMAAFVGVQFAAIGLMSVLLVVNTLGG